MRKNKIPRWPAVCNAAREKKAIEVITLRLLLARWAVWPKASDENPPNIEANEAVDDIHKERAKALLHTWHSKYFIWRAVESPPHIGDVSPLQTTVFQQDESQTFSSAAHEVQRITHEYQSLADAERREIAKLPAVDGYAIESRRNLDRLRNWQVPKKEVEKPPIAPPPSPSLQSFNMQPQASYYSSAPTYYSPPPAALSHPPKAPAAAKQKAPKVLVNVYYDISASDVHFDEDVRHLLLELSPNAQRWTGSTLQGPAILFGFVRNLNAVDINDERAAEKWASTGRSVVVLAFSPNARGQTESFLRPKHFSGQPEEMPELKRSFPTSSKDPFIKCMLRSQTDYARGVTLTTWDKAFGGDSSADLYSYQGMLAQMRAFISEAK